MDLSSLYGGEREMENIKKKRKYKKLIIILVIVLVALCYKYLIKPEISSHNSGSGKDGIIISEGKSDDSDESKDSEKKSGKDGEKDSDSEGLGDSEEDEKSADGYIYVDVGGAVSQPKVVSIPEGSRVFEAIEAAGGTASGAETKYINMASECTDGQKIYVPTADEVAEIQKSGGNVSEVTSSLFSADGSALATSSGTSFGGSQTSENALVNINTASSDELQTLSGIGPSMASRIIDYREQNGAFKSVDELTEVSGIGDKTLAKFKDHICV